MQGRKKSFAHTAQLLRTLEQAAVALRQKEAVLLVGETGTGKSTLVQQLADQVLIFLQECKTSRDVAHPGVAALATAIT